MRERYADDTCATVQKVEMESKEEDEEVGK